MMFQCLLCTLIKILILMQLLYKPVLGIALGLSLIRATGRKVEDPDLLERIRLTIMNNLLKYHPESSELLAMGAAFRIKPPQKKIDVDVATQIIAASPWEIEPSASVQHSSS